MKEIDETKRPDNRWKSLAAVGIVAAAGLGIGYAYQASRLEELTQALTMANSKIELLSSQEKRLSNDLAEAKNRASSTDKDWVKARDENLALTQKLSDAAEQARSREQSLQATISSLTEETTKTKARANALAKAIDPVILKEIDTAMGVVPPDPRSLTQDAALARNKELLRNFTRVSDDFTRPKVYTHDYFLRRRKDSANKGDPRALARLTSLTVNTDGVTSGVTFTSLKVLNGDDVITFTELDSLLLFLKKHDFADGDLKCRLTWDELELGRNFTTLRDRALNLLTSSKVSDLTLDKEDAVAFKETLELAASFEAINRPK